MKRPILLLFLVTISLSTCCAQTSKEELTRNFFAICEARTSAGYGANADTTIFRQISCHLAECDSLLATEPDLENAIVEKAIWENYMACLLAAFTNNQMQFNTPIPPGSPIDSNDITTWDGSYIDQQIIRHFENSLQDVKILQNIDILQYKDLLNSEYNKDYLPTLYNFLAYNYAYCLKNFSTWTWHPFSYLDTNYMATSEEFIAYEIPCLDPEASEYKFLRLCQNLEKVNHNGGYTDAMIFWNMERLLFIQKQLSDKDFKDLFINTLQKLEVRFPQCKARKEIHTQLAKAYLNSSHYGALDIGRQYLIKAGLYHLPMRDGQTWEEWFEMPYYYADFTDKANDHALFARIISRQTDSLYVYFTQSERIWEKKSLSTYVRIERKSIVFDTLISISRSSDYGYDTTLVLFPPLPEMEYFFLLSASPILKPEEDEHTFLLRDELKNYAWWSVCNTSFVTIESPKSATVISVDSRDGSPKPRQTFQLRKDYEWTWWPIWLKNFKSKKDGRATTRISPYRDYEIDTRKEGIANIESDRYPGSAHFSSAINTDRTIYRPGQTVQFKATIEKINSKGQSVRLYKNKKVQVIFYQGNEVFFHDTLRANKFGSIADSCVLPESIQPGKFTLKIAKFHRVIKAKRHRVSYFRGRCRMRRWLQREMGGKNLQIEEYKRPQFEITLKEPEGVYALGDSVCICGQVKAYAGYPMAGTEINYLVFGQNFVAKVGKTTSDTDGNFECWFHTPEISKSGNENFCVIASASDITGETQETQIKFDVKVQPYQLKVEVPELYFEEELPAREVSVSAVNSAGKLQNVSIQYTIEKLTMPQHFLHRPPFYNCNKSQKELGEKFAPWAFNNEDLSSNWPREKIAAEGEMLVAGTSRLTLPQLPSGTYRLFIKSQYSDNKEVESEKYFSIGHKGDTISPIHKGVWAWVDKTEAAPGDTLHFHVGTAIPDATIFVDLFNSEKNVKKFNIVNNQHYTFDYIVKKEDTIRLQLVANCVHLGEHFIALTETELRILPDVTYEWETFRSDLLPGEQTTFHLRFTNRDGTPTDAEVLCYMYDASLDIFAPNDIDHLWRKFNFPKVAPNFQRYTITGIKNYNYKGNFNTQWLTQSEFALVPEWKCSLSRYAFDERVGYGVSAQTLDSRIIPFHAIASSDKNFTSVRGNRSDGQVTFIDGVQTHDLSTALESPGGITSIDGKIVSVNKRFSPAFGSSSDDGQQEEAFTPRTNFAETAFFYPFLRTDENGVVEIKFAMPESVTRWKIQGLAHTWNRQSCVFVDTVRTSKPLMAIGNLPRFAYEGDTLLFSAKVVSTKTLQQYGTAELRVTDAASGNEVAVGTQSFALDSMGQQLLQFPVIIPAGANALTFRFAACSEGDNVRYSDGEEHTIPVLTRRMLTYESAPFFNTKKGDKKFVFSNLPKASDELASYRLVFTPQPAWNAVAALPTLLQPAYESNDMLCNQLVGTAMLMQIARSTDMRRWLHVEVDSARLDEVEARKRLWEANPWLCRARTVEDENLRLEALLKEDRLQQEMSQAQRKLSQGQNADGGWPWFKGGRSNTYITRKILIGIGRARQLGWAEELKVSTLKALQWDAMNVKKDYQRIREEHPEWLMDNSLPYGMLQYLFARSYYLDERHLETEADRFYMGKLAACAEELPTWSEQTMAALTLFAAGDTTAAEGIMENIRRAARHSDELGMYWKDEPRRSCFLPYFSDIERQSLLIEAFEKILKDEESVREMKLWLLQQKRGESWESPHATAQACMTLLTDYQQITTSTADIGLRIGDLALTVADTLQPPVWRDLLTEEIRGREIVLSQPSDGFSYGTLTWQRWQDMDSIVAESSERPLAVARELWHVATDERGDVFEPIGSETMLRPGDRVRVRLTVTADRDMEYVWLRDLHSAAFDANRLMSGFRHEGFPHYRTVRDEAVNYFFEELPKGKFTFEYEMFVTQSGTFSDGYAEVKCVYNPEFTGHSAAKGKVRIEK